MNIVINTVALQFDIDTSDFEASPSNMMYLLLVAFVFLGNVQALIEDVQLDQVHYISIYCIVCLLLKVLSWQHQLKLYFANLFGG